MLFALSGNGELVCFDIASKPGEVWAQEFAMTATASHDELRLQRVALTTASYHLHSGGGDACRLTRRPGAFRLGAEDWTDKRRISAVAATIQGVPQYVQIGYDGKKNIGYIAGVDAKAGKLLWKSQIFSGVNDGVSTSPVVKGNEVFVTAPWGGGCHLFEINKKLAEKELYNKKTQKRFRNTFGGVVVVGDEIYGHTEPSSWICQDWKTGDEKWLERDDLKCQSGAIITAEGLLYLYTDEGEAALVEVDPKAFNKISQLTIPKRSEIPPNRVTSRQSRVWAHPVIANGVLFTRS